MKFSISFLKQSLCAPSRNSLLTGRRPDTLHLYDFYSYWREFTGDYTTLPQYFKNNGYQTFSFGKIFHPGVSSNFTDDYPQSWTEPAYHPSTDRYENAAVCIDPSTGNLVKNLICPVFLPNQPENTLPDIQSMLSAKQKLAEFQNSDKPLFLSIGFHKPHIPFKIPQKYFNYHPVEKFTKPDFSQLPYDLPTTAWNPYNDIRKRYDVQQLNISYPFGPMDHDFGLRIRQSYYAAVTFVDDLIGELLSNVDMSNTIIVLSSDHGWSLGEHAAWSKFSNYDVALKVPLIIRVPNALPTTQIIESVVELLDIFPTLVELAGLPRISSCLGEVDELTCVEGKSLVPLMNWPFHIMFEQYAAFSQYPRPGLMPTISPNSDSPKLRQIKIMGYSIRTRQYRYTLWVRFYPVRFLRDWSMIYGEELYDHSIDWDENINLCKRDELIFVKLELRQKLINKFQ